MTLVWLLAAAPAAADSGRPWTASEAGPLRPVLLKTSKAEFDRPHDIVLAPEGLYLLVADNGNDVVKVLDPGKLAVLAEIGRGELSAPHDVAFDSRGRLLIADTGNHRIVVYDFKGVFRDGEANAERIAVWTDGIDKPEGVAAGTKGRVYVANTGSDTVSMLVDGKQVKRIDGSAGAGPFGRPHDVHVDRAGNVLVVDPGHNRIQVFDAELNYLRQMSGPPHRFNEPKYVAQSEDGLLLVADEYNNQVKIYDSQGKPAGAIGSGVRGDGEAQLNQPEGVDVAGKYIWVADTYNDRIRLYKRK